MQAHEKMMRYKSNYSLFVDLSKQRDWNQSDVKSPSWCWYSLLKKDPDHTKINTVDVKD